MTRVCRHCGGPLPAGCRRNRVYCSRTCNNAAHWQRNKPERQEAQRAWRIANRDRHAAVRLAAKTGRACEECDVELPITSHADRRFCSRRCTNAASLRTARAARHEATQRRRALLAGASSPGVTQRDWLRLVNRFGGRCAYCDQAGPITMDHVVPLSRGGRHSIGNLIPACLSCNAAKRDDLLIYWRHGIAQARLRVLAS